MLSCFVLRLDIGKLPARLSLPRDPGVATCLIGLITGDSVSELVKKGLNRHSVIDGLTVIANVAFAYSSPF